MNLIEKLVLLAAGLLLVFGAVVSHTHPEFFAKGLTREDGFTEWLTVVFLVISMFWAGSRVWLLKGKRGALLIGFYSFVTLALFFVSGEEISWGQRIFGIESSEFFVENNAQGETNLHNLMIGDAKVNKVIFSRGIALFFLLYLAVVVPLYYRNDRVRGLLTRIGVPIPKHYQIASYVIIVIVVEGFMDASRRGELTEIVAVMVATLNLIYPVNKDLFDPEKNSEELS